MDFRDWVRYFREQRTCSQVKLAQLSGVSLPTIQNIEAGKANPSLSVVEKLLGVMGMKLSFEPMPVDWEMAAFLGIPLTNIASTHRTEKPSAEKLKEILHRATVDLLFNKNQTHDERKKEAVVACLLALKSHFPSIYKEFSGKKAMHDLMPKEYSGRLLKLRRLALSRLQSYL